MTTIPKAFTPASLGDDEPVTLKQAVQGFVYFIKVKGFVKIGFARDVYSRMSHIQCASPFPVKLLHAEPSTGRLEGILHDRFNVHHFRGEWFRLCPEITEQIAMLIKARRA